MRRRSSFQRSWRSFLGGLVSIGALREDAQIKHRGMGTRESYDLRALLGAEMGVGVWRQFATGERLKFAGLDTNYLFIVRGRMSATVAVLFFGCGAELHGGRGVACSTMGGREEVQR